MFGMIWNWIRGFDTHFSDLEELLLNRLLDIIEGDKHHKLKKRISNINVIQRHDGGREIIFYQRSAGKIIFPKETRITEQNGIFEIAKFRVLSSDAMTKNKGVILVNDGNLVGIDFIRPTEHASIDQIYSIEIEIVDLKFDEDSDLTR
jgi:hypothetical protein